MGPRRHRSTISGYQIFDKGRGGGYQSIHFLRSLITLYNVPTPIPTTQVTLNQHAGVLLFMPVLSSGKHEENEGLEGAG